MLQRLRVAFFFFRFAPPGVLPFPSFLFPLAGRSNSKGARSQRETTRQERKELRARDVLGLRLLFHQKLSLSSSGNGFLLSAAGKFSLFFSLSSENLSLERERRQGEGELHLGSLTRAPRLESISRTHKPCSSRASLLPSALLEAMEQQRRRQQQCRRRRLATPVVLQAPLLLLLLLPQQQPHRLHMARDEASCHAGRRTLATEVGWQRGVGKKAKKNQIDVESDGLSRRCCDAFPSFLAVALARSCLVRLCQRGA